jgi:UDP-glucose 4-epimerase
MSTILVTGGAGYIGSHAVKALCDGGYKVTVVDNLSKGHRAAVDKRADFEELDLGDVEAMKAFFAARKFDAVMHFAGFIEVGESMNRPEKYYRNNLANGVNLLEAMRAGGVGRIIFSSTAAVYGNPVSVPIKEDDLKKPTNFYGHSKLLFEDVLKKYDELCGFRFVALRYFNACGADASGEIGQDYRPDTHIIPRVLKHYLGVYPQINLNGTDYPTPDGTCVRDYIHVSDLVDAHVKALEYLLKGGVSDAFNLGNGNGFSVKEVIDMAEKVVGRKGKVVVGPRREGDPPVLIADSTKARKILGWQPKYSLEEIVASAWKWHSAHPGGYEILS